MQSSRWDAQGNVYLVAAGPLTAEQVRADVGDADGILEVVASGDDWVEIAIWNPDGSQAEMSGNGTRIAARWHGGEVVTVRVGPRAVRAELREAGSPILERQRVGENLEGSLLELAAKEIEKVKALKQPVEKSGRAVHEDSEILYRAILLPLSENGLAIDGVLGAIGYRDVAL